MLGLAAAVGLATGLAYVPALRNGFVNWDDDIYVYDNPQVQAPGAALAGWALTALDASNWHPVTWLSHGLDVALFGLDPRGHHLTSLLLHAANAALVVLVLAALLRAARGREARGPGWPDLAAAGVAGALFGLHPIHVESAAWIAERKDLLCALFFLGSVRAHLAHAARAGGGPRPWRAYLASLGLFALALASKPMAVSLPAVLLLVDWRPLRRLEDPDDRRRALAEKVPFLLLALLSAWVTVAAQRAGGAVVSLASVPLGGRLTTAARSLLAYLGKMLVPQGLLPFYPLAPAPALSGGGLVAIAAVACATVVALLLARRQPVWLLAWAYYGLTLAPVLGIVQAGGQSMADRYTYLPSLGPFALAGLGLARALQAVSQPAWLRPALAAGAALLLACLGLLTVRQIGIWRDSVTLWTAVIQAAPPGPAIAHYNRGQAFFHAGDLPRAEADYRTAAALQPLYQEALFNHGVALEALGRPGEADQAYRRALVVNPAHARALNNLAVLRGRAGAPAEAMELLDRAVAAAPSYAEAWLNRGVTLDILGRAPEAAADYRRACALGAAAACGR